MRAPHPLPPSPRTQQELLYSSSSCPLPFLPDAPTPGLAPAPVTDSSASRVCSPVKHFPDDCGSPPGSVVRCPSAHKISISCQTLGLYCWRGDKPNHLASCTLALSHCLITVAITAALVSPLGLLVLTVITALVQAGRVRERQMSPPEGPREAQLEAQLLGSSARNSSDLLGSHLP